MTVTGLLDDVRQLGIAMGSWYAPVNEYVNTEGEVVREIRRQRFVGWTTDETKAVAAAELGAVLRPYVSRDPLFSGWEVTVTVDT